MTKPREDWSAPHSPEKREPCLVNLERREQANHNLTMHNHLMSSNSQMEHYNNTFTSNGYAHNSTEHQQHNQNLFQNNFQHQAPSQDRDYLMEQRSSYSHADLHGIPKLENLDLDAWTSMCQTPSLCEAILETDAYLQNIGIDDSPSTSVKMELENETNSFNPDQQQQQRTATNEIQNSNRSFHELSLPNAFIERRSPNRTPTNTSPILTPTIGSPNSTANLMSTLLSPHDEGPLLEDLFRAIKSAHQPMSNAATNFEANDSADSGHRFQNSDLPSAKLKRANHSPGIQTGYSTSYNPHGRPTSKAPTRYFTSGLDPIPENDVPQLGSNHQSQHVPQILIPITVPKPVTTTYNISFPTSSTLSQFSRESQRYDIWRSGHSGGYNFHRNMSPGSTASAASPGSSSYFYSCSSTSSPASLQSPFHGAQRNSLPDLNEFQPLNFIQSDGTTTRYNLPSRNLSGEKVSNKASKRSYTNEESSVDDLAGILNPIDDDTLEDQADGASMRQRKKSSPPLPETRRRNSIKEGIDELHRIIPHLGTPENDKISQASVLFEASKFIRNLRDSQEQLSAQITQVKMDIDKLNQQIEVFQNQLPDTGAPQLPPRALTTRTLPQLFHDHVIDQTMENWRYWVFTAIVGHFVHSFANEVSSSSFAEMETTSLEWVTNSMTLQQLRKDAYRKLAKLCVKTSIVENPSKLPQEAIDFATHRGKGSKKPSWFTEHPWP